jgi:hypothetical protein
MKIVWHTIPDFPEYEINRLGEIRRKSTGRVLKPFDDRRGYLRVSLNGCNVKVHLLVAKLFVPNPHGYPVVDHKRGNKHDNRASQLEWSRSRKIHDVPTPSGFTPPRNSKKGAST